MTREIWNGKGDAEGKVYFVTKAGRVVGRPYVRSVAQQALRRYYVTTDYITDALRTTVDDDAWLAPLHGCLPAAVARAVIRAEFAP